MRRDAALRCDRIDAPYVLDQPINAQSFTDHVEQCVVPTLSPEPNPIEQVFAKLRHLMRNAAERSREATWRRVGSRLDTFSPDKCRNYLVNSGYGSA